MLSEALIEREIDRLDSYPVEARRQVEYITEQLLYHRREAEDVAILTDRLSQLSRNEDRRQSC